MNVQITLLLQVVLCVCFFSGVCALFFSVRLLFAVSMHIGCGVKATNDECIRNRHFEHGKKIYICAHIWRKQTLSRAQRLVSVKQKLIIYSYIECRVVGNSDQSGILIICERTRIRFLCEMH